MSRLPRALPLLVAVIAFVTFLPALDGAFLDWDDDRNFLWNTGYRGLGMAQIRWMFTATWMGHYIPLTWLSLGFNYVLGGMAPWGYHVGNLLIHAANAALVFFVARRLLTAATVSAVSGERGHARAGAAGDVPVALGAAAAALLWAVHPLRVESVAWITERRDVLSGFFYLLSVLTYLRGVTRDRTLSGGWLAASLLTFAAALGSKAMAMTLPLTLLVLDVYPLRRLGLGGWSLIREKLGHFALAGLGALVASWAVTRGAGWTSYDDYGIGARLAMTGYSFWFYPWKLIWPERLSPLYELPAHVSLLDTRFVWPTVGVVMVTTLLVLARRRLPGALAAWTQSMIVLAPVSGIAHAGHQLAHDRYSYLSGLGFVVLAGAGVTWLTRQRASGRVSRWVYGTAVTAAGLALLGLGAGTWAHTRIWRDSESLWRAAVSADPSCALCHQKLGEALQAAGLPAPAEAELTRAVALRPDRPTVHNSLGAFLVSRDRLGEAEAEFREAIRLMASYPDAVANLGVLHARQRKYPEAIAELRRALAMSPQHANARRNLAFALDNAGIQLAQAGRPGDAVALFREATTLEPQEYSLWRDLGQALVDSGRAVEAIAPLERAVTLHPRGANERFWLARAYLVTNRTHEAQAQIAVLESLDAAAAASLSATRGSDQLRHLGGWDAEPARSRTTR
jgi:Flp pilus assembly protein TadD